MKKLAVIALCAAMAISATGCKEKEIVVSGGGTEFVPDVRDIPVDINDIDWDQVREDMEGMLGKDEYPKSSYIDFAIYPDSNQILLIWVMDNAATEQDAIEYGPVIMKAFNDAYVNQDNTVAPSTETYRGGIWDKWDVVLQLYRDADILDETSYYVNQEIKAGSNDAIERYVYVEPETTESDDEDAEEDEDDEDEDETEETEAESESAVSTETTASGN